VGTGPRHASAGSTCARNAQRAKVAFITSLACTHIHMDLLALIQWPAFAASLAAAWLVASRDKSRRNVGFWIFLLSNVLWVVWGIHTDAWALIALQVCLAALNVRGLFKTEET
jgi:hypothetical protein